MQKDLEKYWHMAEYQYLNKQEIGAFKSEVQTLRQRLKVYGILRDKELEIFQGVATELSREFRSEEEKNLERALKHWISVLRYCAMAMLLNNPEYLQHRLLEWLTDVVKAYRMETIESSLHGHLVKRLSEYLSAGEMALLEPFLERAKTELLSEQEQTATVI